MKIIAFEGLDAAGKQSQTEMLAQVLRGRGYRVSTESFPRYDTAIGKLIGQWLRGDFDLSPEAAQLLYEADRQDFQKSIDAAEMAGYDYMILDRFSLSNIAFGIARGFDLMWMRGLQAGYRQPDATIILDVNSRTSFARKGEGRDRNELDVGLLNRARAAYAHLGSESETDTIYTLNANGDKGEVHEAVLELLDNGFL